ncbi:conserved exported protein of unknown function (plasmid) [Ralstonia solanacearum Po82]|uniref:Transmembrane protein n=2 Tax=Ralstonia solanacearum TaxID=305 RepID=F6G9R9_RALS8|nr:conserved exported protein of unknown function [Ralstonia solanacearum Po82]
MHGGRGGTELRGQRQAAGQRHFRPGLGAAGVRRCRRGARCGPGRTSSARRRAAPAAKRRPHARHAAGLQLCRCGDRLVAAHPGRGLHAARRSGAVPGCRRAAGRWPCRRLVPRAHGVRPARARLAFDSRRCAQSRDAERDEPEDQEPRIVPPVRARGARGARRRVVRTGPQQSVHAVRGGRQPRQAAGIEHAGPGPGGHRAAQMHPLRGARGDARRLFRAGADRGQGCQSAPARTAAGLPWADRLPGAGQHLVQRARRADRGEPGQCLSVLHAHADGLPRRRQLPDEEVRPAGPGRAPRLAQGIRAGLIPERETEMMRNPLSSLFFGLVFLLVFVPLGWLIRLADPMQLRRRASGSYLRLLQSDTTPAVAGAGVENPDLASKA